MKTIGQLVAEELRGRYVPAPVDCVAFSTGAGVVQLRAGDMLEHCTYGGRIVVRFYVNTREDNDRYPRWYVDMNDNPAAPPLYQTAGHVLDMLADRVYRRIPATS